MVLNDLKNQIDQWQQVLNQRFEQLPRNDLGYGKAGIVLFQWYKFLAYEDEKDLEICEKQLILLASHVNSSLVSPSSFIFVELTEIGILLSILDNRYFKNIDVADFQSQIDTILIANLTEFLSKGNLDPYTGAGYLFHYLSYLKNDTINEIFIEHIKKNHQEDSYGYYLGLQKNKPVQLGITHGQAFVVLYLARITHLNHKRSNLDLLEKFVGSLEAQRQDHQTFGSFFSDNYGKKQTSRLSVCYGDLGILYALYLGHEVLGYHDKMEEIRKMFEKTTGRIKAYFRNTQIDLSLLYGFTGISLFYQVLSNRHKNLISKVEANDLHQQILEELSKPETRTMLTDISTKNLSLSEGYTGILLYCMGHRIRNYDFATMFYFS